MDKLGMVLLPTSAYTETFHSMGISGDGINTPLGIDTNYYTPYNETLLWSCDWKNDIYHTADNITFSEPINNFERLMFIHPQRQNSCVKFYGIPKNNTAYFLMEEPNGNTLTGKDIYWNLYKFDSWSSMNFQRSVKFTKATNTTAAETYSVYTTANTGAWLKNGNLGEVWGINRKV